MDLSRHPIQLVREIEALCHGNSPVLEFARYSYIPQHAGTYPRELFKIPAAEVTPRWLMNQLAALKPDQELALQSRIYYGQRVRHIGMLDFDGEHEADPRQRLKPFLTTTAFNRLKIYSSGRSLHGYMPMLMSQDQWVTFLARLLMAADPGKPPLIDTRWIGHRLIEGYAALRWSCNTKQYKQLPELKT